MDSPLGYVPHFDVTDVSGRRVPYRQFWQRRNLVLVLIAPGQTEAAARYASELDARREDFAANESAVVVTADSMPGLPPPRVVVADRWGEIVHIEPLPAGEAVRFPAVDALLSWVRFLQMQCPECPP